MGKYLRLFKDTAREFNEDKVPRLGAALAYYTIFSIGPLLLIAVAMAGLFLGQEAARGQISGELGKIFGPEMSKSLEGMIEAAAKPKSGRLATIVGVLTLMLGASGLFGQLKDALNTIWNVEKKPVSGIVNFIQTRFLSMAMVLGIGFLLLVSLVFDAVISAMGPWLERLIGGEALIQFLSLILSFAISVVLFAAIFRILPDLKIAWHDVWLGAVFTSLLFALGKWGLGVYLGKAAVGSAYGAAGSLVILLVWVYWSAQILFFGAEFTQVYARTFGSMRGDTSKKEAAAQADRVEDRPKSPATLPAHAASGLGKLAAGGAIGLLAGAILTAVSAVGLVFKMIRKIVVPSSKSPRGALWTACGLPPLWVTCNGAAHATLPKAVASHAHSKALRRGAVAGPLQSPSVRMVKVVVVVVLVVAFALLVRALPVADWLEQFKAWVQGVGPIGYVLYVLVYILCCTLLVPALALTLGAGAIFGFVGGAIVNLIGATLGATAAFSLARTVMRHRVERMTSGSAKFAALDRAITREGTKIMWLVRVSGFPPFTWVNYAFGLTGIHIGPFLMTTFFGIIPGTIAFTYAGAAGAAALSGSGNRVLLIVTAVGAVLVSAFIARIATQAIRRAGVEDEATAG